MSNERTIWQDGLVLCGDVIRRDPDGNPVRRTCCDAEEGCGARLEIDRDLEQRSTDAGIAAAERSHLLYPERDFAASRDWLLQELERTRPQVCGTIDVPTYLDRAAHQLAQLRGWDQWYDGKGTPASQRHHVGAPTP